ncbi:hypothetical protein KXD93_22330 [Mucilaginibacter sp. BJC16-A38]|uniref:hypothetical protein n=1 Tax=Mucilaginibacter phenanthrenivorans TaxID=1234842 RepID=UPI002158921A|nr:hypothetical protein [Mucilaginibacter phenanthrenivorans]MCR8560408.1 hypothetical protein [Mucilaginibacter phenanthrenivorans]
MKYILRFILIFSICGCALQKASAQYTIMDKAPCPEGPGSALDTVFYSPTTPMPFDECFVLKITLKGNIQPRYFAVNPVDRFGNLDPTRRDYHTYLKTVQPDPKKRRAFKKAFTYELFRANKINRLFSTIICYNRGTTTDVMMHVPPLTPNRDYKIILITDNVNSLKALYSSGEIVFRTAAFPPDQAANNAINQKLHQMIVGNDIKGNGLNYNVTPQKIVDFLAHDTLVYNQDISPPTAVVTALLDAKKLPHKLATTAQYSFFRRYRIFFKPTGSATALNLGNAMAVDPQRYVEAIPKSDPESLTLSDSVMVGGVKVPLNDVDGNPVKFHTDSRYEVYFFCYEEFDDLGTHGVTKEPVSFFKLMDLEEKNGGKELSATVNPAAPNNETIAVKKNTVRLYQDMDKSVSSLATTNVYKVWPQDDLKQVMSQAVLCPCSNKGIRDLTQANDLLHIISLLNVATPAQLESMRSGLLSSKDLLATPAKNGDYTARAANLKFTLGQLQLLNDFLRNIIALEPGNASYNAIYTQAMSYRADLQAESDAVDNINKLTAKITAAYDKLFPILEERNTLVSTETLDFMSTYKLRIVPDFGFIGVFTGDKVFHFSDLAPYLGFEVDFRSINKNIPMRLVHYKDIWYYLSFSAGLTLTSLAIPNRRADLFGNQNLLTGFGFRINNSFRVTAGTVWFKTINKNPLETNQPLGFSPFIGLSLDLDLQTLFGGISKLFK